MSHLIKTMSTISGTVAKPAMMILWHWKYCISFIENRYTLLSFLYVGEMEGCSAPHLRHTWVHHYLLVNFIKRHLLNTFEFCSSACVATSNKLHVYMHGMTILYMHGLTILYMHGLTIFYMHACVTHWLQWCNVNNRPSHYSFKT